MRSSPATTGAPIPGPLEWRRSLRRQAEDEWRMATRTSRACHPADPPQASAEQREMDRRLSVRRRPMRSGLAGLHRPADASLALGISAVRGRWLWRLSSFIGLRQLPARCWPIRCSGQSLRVTLQFAVMLVPLLYVCRPRPCAAGAEHLTASTPCCAPCSSPRRWSASLSSRWCLPADGRRQARRADRARVSVFGVSGLSLLGDPGLCPLHRHRRQRSGS